MGVLPTERGGASAEVVARRKKNIQEAANACHVLMLINRVWEGVPLLEVHPLYPSESETGQQNGPNSCVPTSNCHVGRENSKLHTGELCCEMGLCDCVPGAALRVRGERLQGG